jgi:mannonate dehydratase
MYIPNDYVYQLAEDHPNEFVATCSVHPFRANALEELERCRKRGIKLIKWLPNSMNINPADPDERYDSFYEKVKELDMFLLIHVGAEHSVTSRFHNDELGNPLHLIRQAQIQWFLCLSYYVVSPQTIKQRSESDCGSLCY